MRIEDLAGRSVALIGMGADNSALLPHLIAVGPADLTVGFDDPESVGDDVADLLTRHGLSSVSASRLPRSCEVLVRSPGYPRYRQQIVDLEASGSEVTTPLALWLSRHAPGRLFVGITGTKGKSSTTSATAAFIEAAGADAVVVGNIGVPAWSTTPRPGSILVVEVSSYQAVDVAAVPDIGVLTSLSSDHVSWHGGQENYVRDKTSLFGGPDLHTPQLLVPAGEQNALEAVGHLHPIPVDIGDERFDSLVRAALERSLSGPVLQNVVTGFAAASVALGRLRDPDTRETAGSVDALSALGLLPESVALAGVRSFQPLQSRHEFLGIVEGARVVDDALATNPNAAAVSLAAYQDRQVVMIIGGEDRSVDLGPLMDAIVRHRPRLTLVTVPDNGRAMAAAIMQGSDVPESVEVHHAADMAEAVSIALAEAAAAASSVDRGSTPYDAAPDCPGEPVILFAPGAPTPGHLGTWKDRSADLRRALGLTPGP